MIERDFSGLEQHWQIKLPQTFRKLYQAYELPVVGILEFFDIDTLLSDLERWKGMLPQFFPFAEDVDENIYGFFLKDPLEDNPQILFWNHEYDHYYPAGSDFKSFLRNTIIISRFMAQDRFDEDEIEDDDYHSRQIAITAGISETVVTEKVARNERELYEKICSSDSQNAFALSFLGSQFFSKGDFDKAADCFVRASEASPWYADPIYLLAETYFAQGNMDRARDLWWKVVHLPIVFSSRTMNFPVRANEVDSEVYESTAKRVLKFETADNAHKIDSHLWNLLSQKEPFSAASRIQLAKKYKDLNDIDSSLREYMNALTLSTINADTMQAYAELESCYTVLDDQRSAKFCKIDRELK